MKFSKWDDRFMDLARSISTYSKDPQHKVGAVIASNPGNMIVSHGYNGPPKGVIDIGLEREQEVMRTLHAELNAILNSHLADLKDYTMYVYPFMPCAQCAAAIIQKRIARVVFYQDCDLGTWKASQQEAVKLFNEASISYQIYWPGGL